MCYRSLTCNVEILVWLYILIIWKRKENKISYSLIFQKGKIYKYPWDVFLMFWTLLGLGHDTKGRTKEKRIRYKNNTLCFLVKRE